MSEPTKEAREVALKISCDCTRSEYNRFGCEDQVVFDYDKAAAFIDAHTASLREELRAAREALKPFVQMAERALEAQSESRKKWYSEMPDTMTGPVICVSMGAVRRARAACKGGDTPKPSRGELTLRQKIGIDPVEEGSE